MARDAFLYAGSTRPHAARPGALRRIAGYGSSPVVTYDGEGIYFLDKVRAGVWRLEVYPDAVPVRDPFEPPSADKIVTRAIRRAWPMTITLPDLGDAFTVQPVTPGNAGNAVAVGGRFTVTPGVYVLSGTGAVDRRHAAGHARRRGIRGVSRATGRRPAAHGPVAGGPEYLAGATPSSGARRRSDAARLGPCSCGRLPAASIARFRCGQPAHTTTPRPSRPRRSAEGPYEYVITVFRRTRPRRFPRACPGGHGTGTTTAARLDAGRRAPRTPLVLFDPPRDAARLTFTRIGDAGRRGLFRVGLSADDGPAGLPPRAAGGHERLEPGRLHGVARDQGPDPVAGGEPSSGATTVRLRLRGLGPRQTLHVTLMEDDGTSWTAAVPVDSAWSERSLPLVDVSRRTRRAAAAGIPGRVELLGGSGGWTGRRRRDRPRLDQVERLQLSLRREDGVTATPGGYGVEVESVILRLGRRD